MPYTKNIYQPYKIIKGVEYYRVGTVAEICDRSRETIQLWDSYSDKLVEEGNERLIPKSTRIGAGKTRCWTEEEIDKIVKFSKQIKYGSLAKFSRTRWGSRAHNLKRDNSLEHRNKVKKYRNQVNLEAKKKKVLKIKTARKDMLRTVRGRAKSIYNLPTK